MPISWDVLEQDRVLRVVITETPVISEILTFLEQLAASLGDSQPLPAFYDLTEMETGGLGDRFIREAVVLDRKFRATKRGRQAYVTADPRVADFVDGYMAVIGKYSFAPVARHFRGAQAARALDWLLLGEADLPDRMV